MNRLEQRPNLKILVMNLNDNVTIKPINREFIGFIDYWQYVNYISYLSIEYWGLVQILINVLKSVQ